MFVLDALGAYPWVAYWVAVTLGALLVFAWFQIRITRTENKRVRQLKDLDDFSTLSTDSPLEDADKKALRTGLKSVHTRFRATRRILFPGIVLLWAVAMAFPLLNQLPATVISSFLGIIAVVDIQRHPERHGLGRAIFGILMGLLGCLALAAVLYF